MTTSPSSAAQIALNALLDIAEHLSVEEICEVAHALEGKVLQLITDLAVASGFCKGRLR